MYGQQLLLSYCTKDASIFRKLSKREIVYFSLGLRVLLSQKLTKNCPQIVYQNLLSTGRENYHCIDKGKSNSLQDIFPSTYTGIKFNCFSPCLIYRVIEGNKSPIVEPVHPVALPLLTPKSLEGFFGHLLRASSSFTELLPWIYYHVFTFAKKI